MLLAFLYIGAASEATECAKVMLMHIATRGRCSVTLARTPLRYARTKIKNSSHVDGRTVDCALAEIKEAESVSGDRLTDDERFPVHAFIFSRSGWHALLVACMLVAIAPS